MDLTASTLILTIALKSIEYGLKSIRGRPERLPFFVCHTPFLFSMLVIQFTQKKKKTESSNQLIMNRQATLLHYFYVSG
ncbi:MAG: hypothetical protein CR997_10585 [Acidobacteria bacterium]|nr:MAG: hypothetical protein CR997_10585 [Acidobacteriota bacterium]